MTIRRKRKRPEAAQRFDPVKWILLVFGAVGTYVVGYIFYWADQIYRKQRLEELSWIDAGAIRDRPRAARILGLFAYLVAAVIVIFIAVLLALLVIYSFRQTRALIPYFTVPLFLLLGITRFAVVRYVKSRCC